MCTDFAFFLGSAQKPPGGHACAARRFISLCVDLVSDGLNRLAGMNVRQAVRQYCNFVRFAFYTRALGFLIVSVCVDSMSRLELGSGKVEYTHV